jgi:hypothetical protein
MIGVGHGFLNRTCVQSSDENLSKLSQDAQGASRAADSPRVVNRISILAASLASVVCMAMLFVTVALAAGPPPAAHGKAARTQGLCFLVP